jgi:hypothetical protein
MAHLFALLIFFAITAVTWFVAVATYQSLLGGPDLRQHANFTWTTFVSVLLVTLISFAPFPWGYYFSLGAWALAARGMLELPWLRAIPLFLILAALSFLSRLAILGVLSY